MEPIVLLQTLLRFPTINPPGNEAACIYFLRDLLSESGIETQILARDMNRPNLVARIRGQGRAAPLLLYGHIDVVGVEGQQWCYPPFAAEIHDGMIWGRGTLDMKGGVAMLVSAFLRSIATGLPPGDLLLAIVSDEEHGGVYGARFLVEEYPHLFEGVRYALGEFGAATLTIDGRRFYPMMVAERQTCWIRATLRGPGGHGAMPPRNSLPTQLGRLLSLLEQPLPIHVTPVARQFFQTLAAHLPWPNALVARSLTSPALADLALQIIGPRGAAFNAMLRHTAAATIIQSGGQINVIPAQATVDLDGRLLPGFRPDDLLEELRARVGDSVELTVMSYEPGPTEPDLSLFPLLGEVLKAADPGAIPMPMLGTGVTDARFFSRLGIQTYGFTPMRLPPDLNFAALLHAADERIPVDAPEWGTQAILAVIQRMGRDTAAL